MSPADGRQTEKPGRRQWVQAVIITAAALGLYAAVRVLPTGTNLSHMDFRVEGTGSIEMCDPANPQFIPVVAVRSPVEMTVSPATPPTAGVEVAARVRLRTATGKPLAPADLLLAHTRRLHLLIVDESLTDYQHVHPEPGAVDGDWEWAFTPRFGGTYRIFGDFTPAATARGLYASTDLMVAGARNENARWTREVAPGVVAQFTPAGAAAPGARSGWRQQRDGHEFVLTAAQPELRAGQPLDLRLTVTRADRGAVMMEKVMDAYAHLVAFDRARSGFAHLHPAPDDLAHAPDAASPALSFKITIPRAGNYVIWAQMLIGGSEVFVPFELDVVE